MADRSTGPVKPPVIDLTARPSTPKPETKAEAKPEAKPEPAPKATPKPGATDASPGISRRNDAPRRFRLPVEGWPLLGAAAVGGAVLGTVLTYLVATVLPLPGRAPAVPPELTASVSAQNTRLAALEVALGDLKGAGTSTRTDLDAATTRLDAAIADLRKGVADTRAAIPAPTDLAPLETELKTLQSQIDAIAAGASGADAGAIAQSIAALETGLGSLTSRIDGVDSTVRALRTDLDAARKSLADHISAALPSEAGPALRLPLILSGLESAFASGRPFTVELASLASVVPDLAVPAELRAAAAGGMSRPDVLIRDVEAVVPDILAARTGVSGGDWVQNSLDWAKSLLALRPADEIEGDSPEALVSRLEGAMGRRDFAAAAALIAQMPKPMQDAAAPVAADIALHANADRLVTDLRARALAPVGTSP